MTDDADDLSDLDPRERARARRRDRDLAASARELMRTGQAKVFKQVLDRQARRASEPVVRGRRRTAGATEAGPGDEEPGGSERGDEEPGGSERGGTERGGTERGGTERGGSG